MIKLKKLVVNLIGVLTLVAGTVVANAADEATRIEFTVIKAERYKFADTRRLAWHIVAPKAVTDRQRAAVAAGAARILWKEAYATEATAWLQIGPEFVGSGYVLAKAVLVSFTGKVEVEASSLKISARDVELLRAVEHERDEITRRNRTGIDDPYAIVRKKFRLKDNYLFPHPYTSPFDASQLPAIAVKSPNSIPNPPDFDLP